MSGLQIVLITAIGLHWIMSGAAADVFEPLRPADTHLREALADDRALFYFQAPGIDHRIDEQRVSDVKALGVDDLIRPQGLRDIDRSFDMSLSEQLNKSKSYNGAVPGNNPLVLLEYASPVLADVLKHYRMTTFERLGIEVARLTEIERASEDRAYRLSRQSERACLEANEKKGLVAAMSFCQKALRPFDNLMSVDGSVTLHNGSRRFHVIAQALGRLGLNASRIEKIVAMTGDTVVSDRGYEQLFPARTIHAAQVLGREKLVRKWHDALEKYRVSRRGTKAMLENISLPGVPVTDRVLASLLLLDEDERELMVLKLSSAGAWFEMERDYRQASAYLDLCQDDPALSGEYRDILREKKEELVDALARASALRGEAVSYKDLVSSVADAADTERGISRERMLISGEQASMKRLMFNLK